MEATTTNSDINTLRLYAPLTASYRELSKVMEQISQVSTKLFSGEYILVTYSDRGDGYTEYYKMREDEIEETYYIKSSRALPHTANLLVTKSDKLLAINTYTGFATCVVGQVELIRKDLMPNNYLFCSRLKLLHDTLVSASDCEIIRVD